ncbi:MAG: DUF3048 domain-containing protein [Actinomycetes bacterium]|jgi:hypothetical protein|nr:DUF3048 domain-containing protein [Actinomycetes bacterium]
MTNEFETLSPKSSLRRSRSGAALALVLLLVVAMAVVSLSGCKKKAPVVVNQPATETTTTAETTPVAAPLVWPFTGLPADTVEETRQRPLSIKIENSALARPQKGLNRADIVYETIAEGGITRFNCIFQSNIPKEVGPVRSARLSDCWIVPQYGQPLFFYSGSNSQVSKRLKKYKIARLYHGKLGTPTYHRVSFRSAPHNLYLTLSSIYKVAEKKGYKTAKTTDYKGLAYADRTVVNNGVESATDTYVANQEQDLAQASTETTATKVTIPFSTYFKMSWKWDAEKGYWKRYTNGKKHKDGIDNKQVHAVNVVVMWAKYTLQNKKDPAGNGTYDITLGGSGKCSVFVHGKRINGTWEATRDAPPVFKDENGNEIKLDPGNTWFEVPPKNIKIKVAKS